MLSRIPPVTRALLYANIAIFLLQYVVPVEWQLPLQLWPVMPDGPLFGPGTTFLPWQPFTSGFLHADLLHVGFNMLGLVMFGSRLEYQWRSRRYFMFYAVCLLGAGLCQLAVATWSATHDGAVYATIGASGAIYGLILGYAMLFPNDAVMLPFPPIPMKARTLAIVYGVMALALGLFGGEPGVAHFAHLGGMLSGWLLILFWRRRPPGTSLPPPRKRRPSHLRVVK